MEHPNAMYLEESLLKLRAKRDEAKAQGDINKVVVLDRLIDVVSSDLKFDSSATSRRENANDMEADVGMGSDIV